MTGLQLKSVTSYMSGRQGRILLELSELDGSPDTRGLHLLDDALFAVEDIPAKEAVPETTKVNRDADKVSIPEEVVPATTTTTTITTRVSLPLLNPQLTTLAHRVAHIVGLGDANRLVFLDTHSWVCSADLDGFSDSSVISYSRHFFLPYDWLAGTRDVICGVARRDVLFARNDDVAIIKGGLEYAEKVDAEVPHAVRFLGRLE